MIGTLRAGAMAAAAMVTCALAAPALAVSIGPLPVSPEATEPSLSLAGGSGIATSSPPHPKLKFHIESPGADRDAHPLQLAVERFCHE